MPSTSDSCAVAQEQYVAVPESGAVMKPVKQKRHASMKEFLTKANDFKQKNMYAKVHPDPNGSSSTMSDRPCPVELFLADKYKKQTLDNILEGQKQDQKSAKKTKRRKAVIQKKCMFVKIHPDPNGGTSSMSDHPCPVDLFLIDKYKKQSLDQTQEEQQQDQKTVKKTKRRKALKKCMFAKVHPDPNASSSSMSDHPCPVELFLADKYKKQSLEQVKQEQKQGQKSARKTKRSKALKKCMFAKVRPDPNPSSEQPVANLFIIVQLNCLWQICTKRATSPRRTSQSRKRRKVCFPESNLL